MRYQEFIVENIRQDFKAMVNRTKKKTEELLREVFPPDMAERAISELEHDFTNSQDLVRGRRELFTVPGGGIHQRAMSELIKVMLAADVYQTLYRDEDFVDKYLNTEEGETITENFWGKFMSFGMEGAAEDLPHQIWQLETMTPEERQVIFDDPEFDPVRNLDWFVLVIQDYEEDDDEDSDANKGMQRDIAKDSIPEGDKVLIKVGDNLSWWLLDRAYCGIEARAMGHCGNSPSKFSAERIVSLRSDQGDSLRPHLTFILHDDGYLGEMKGFKNSRPKEEYHDAIVELLKHPKIKGIRGGGYKPNNNFNWHDDLHPDHSAEVKKARPDLDVQQQPRNDPNQTI